jgi:hypothetical protein
MWKSFGLIGAAGLLLAACGTTPEERGITGAGLGAAAGAVGGELAGGEAGTGALIGGAAGAATGALTDRDDIDIGDPIWEEF